MFGANLRRLCAGEKSISALCRRLGINRTQFNRYLSGESFPRPDVLHRICTFFEVDARILLEPVESLSGPGTGPLNHAELQGFINTEAAILPETLLPSGLFRFCRPSFMVPDQFVLGMFLIYRKEGQTFLRGYEVPEALTMQGLPANPYTREFRGLVFGQEGGVAVLISRRGSLTCSFNFVSRVPSFENNFWIGYAARTVPESPTAYRTTRQVYEFLGTNRSEILKTARMSGFITREQLLPFHQILLSPDTPFR